MPYPPQESGRESLGGLLLHSGEYVRVHCQSEGRGAAEALLDHLRVYARAEQLGCAGVAEVVESDPGKMRLLDHWPEISLGDVVGVQRFAVGWQKTRPWS